MQETSSRILVDRTVIRLNGRPFFTFGPRLLLTPAERLPQVLRDIAALGFTTVGSPPCSPGTLPLMRAFFDAAEQAGLMVILLADPRLPEHGRYLAEQFRHRTALHSYVLSPRPDGNESLESYQRERDSLRVSDLFHPILIPLEEEQFHQPWLRAQDIYTPSLRSTVPAPPRYAHQQPGITVRRLVEKGFGAPARPILFLDLRVCVSDNERAQGIFADDPWVSRLSPNAIEWFPHMANLVHTPRRDMLGPDPEILRLQVYDAISSGARGMLLDFHEAMAGPMPYSGRDRLCEAAILAQEIAVFYDFFAEGRLEPLPLETGHPRLSASVIRHGHDHLIVLRMNGYEEDYFVDEAYMQRTEVDVMIEATSPLRAWRMDFPGAHQLETQQDRAGAIRFLAGPLELTGLILLTAGTQRSQEIAAAISQRLPIVAKLSVDILEVRLAKLLLVEGELATLGVGINNEERLRAIARGLDEARNFLKSGDFTAAFNRARQATRLSRLIIKYQMAKALATPIFEHVTLRTLLRNSYYTLPRFYREGAIETARAFTDLT